MPPWHADPRHGTFANDRRLTVDEKALLRRWLDDGLRRGDVRRMPPPRADETRWQIGTPDVVLELPEVSVPASGELPYHDYQVEAPFDRDVWVVAAEARPGNPRVVHHIIVEYWGGHATGAGSGDPRTSGSLGGYVPGDGPLVMSEGLGRRIPAGATIAFQIHYTPSGEPERDRSRLGLVLADAPPRHESKTGLVSTPFLWIPAGAESVEVEAEVVFAREALLLSMRPHMHLRGKSFEYRARYPEGGEEILLRVPNYDFDWQTSYVLAKPKRMPRGTRLIATAIYDNSARNPRNPDPSRNVSWGQQTQQEMMIGFFQYYEPSDVVAADGTAGR